MTKVLTAKELNNARVNSWRMRKGYDIYINRYSYLVQLGVEASQASKMRHWSEKRIEKYLKENNFIE